MKTVESHLACTAWHAGLTRTHWRILIACFLGWVFDGFEAFALVVILFPALHSVLSPEQMGTRSVYAGLVIGITLLGWGVGGLVGGIMADYFGRKRMMLWSVFLYALLSGQTAFSQTLVELCALRFLTGLAMGSEWSTGISLLSETWPERARAKGAGLLQSGFGWGTLAAAVIWHLLSSANPLGQDTWRLMFAVGAVPALFVLYIRRGVDESEEWKRAVLHKRWGATSVDLELKSTKRPFTLRQLFIEREARRRMLLAFVLSAVSTTGWWAISSWLPTYAVSTAAAQGIADAATWGSKITIYYTMGAIVAYMASGFIADSIGRRWFIFLTFLGCLASTYVMYALTSTMGAMSFVAPVNGFFTLGCAFAWMAIYPAELFTSTVRATAISFVFNAARIIAWIFPIIAGSIIQAFGGVANAALVLSLVYLIGLIVPWFLPETTGRGMPE